MGPCPYCGEKIGAEARVCKHCDRTVLYSVFLTATLNEKQKHDFLKTWQREELASHKHTRFGSYSDSKKLLDKIPTLLAWDLNFYSATALSKRFESFAAEPRLQGGLPSNFTPEVESPSSSKGSWANALNLGIAVGLIVAAAVFFHKKFQSHRPATESVDRETRPRIIVDDGASLSLPPIEIIQTSQNSQPPSLTDDGQIQNQAFSKEKIEYVLGATVFISGENSLGSGFLVSPDGYIVSNKHVTSEMQRPIVTLQNGQKFEAEKIKEDSRYDLSLIKIDARDLAHLKMGDAGALYPGEPVLTVGNPGGLAFTITRGIVSFNGRMIQGIPHIQTDAAINRGNSGGPMINTKMEVVGINTLTSLGEQGISFALPINLACDSEGLTRGLNTTPLECVPYSSPQSAADSATVRGPDPRKAQGYSKEAEDLKLTLQRQEQDLNDRMNSLNARIRQIQAEAAEDPHNRSLVDRLNQEVLEIQSVAKQLQRSQLEYRLQYLNGIASVLERQLADPDYFHVRNQVERQLQDVIASREQIKEALD